jgi:predicted ester cyclase
MDLNEMKRITALYFRATNERDGSLINDYLADEIIFNIGCGKDRKEMQFKNPKDHTIHYNIKQSESFYLKKTIVFQVAEGDMVVNYLTFEGIHDKTWMGHKPTGNSVRYNGMYAFRFEDGLIKEIWATGDLHILMEQIGII